MFRNYLKVAFRNLWKNKGYSAINIIGLAVGLATCLLILLFVWDELSFDKFHSKADRIYRVDSDIKFGGSALRIAVSSDPMGATLKRDYPQVEQYTRIYASSGAKLLKKDDSYINEEKIAYVDSTFFDVFSFPLLSGNSKTALNDPNTAVVSESAAMKYFGTTLAIGKLIETNDKVNYRVTAVMKDMPGNSHFIYDVLLSMDNVSYDFGNYLSHNFHTYIVLKEGADPAEFKRIFREVLNKYVLAQAKAFMSIKSMEEFESTGNYVRYSLMPLTDIHLKSDKFPELSANGNEQNVFIFSAVAFFILMIACINFMNLSTARSANRAKEVGIRKVLGTEKSTLIRQFLTESTLVSFISLMIALLITLLILPFFNDLSGKSLTIKSLFQPGFLPILIIIPLVVGILAGSYPAFYLSSFQPITVLKGKLAGGFKKSSFRSGLVVVQFTATIFLIIATIVVYSQLDYIQTRKLGFSKEQVLMIDNAYVLGEQAEPFRQEVLKLSGVQNGTLSSFLPVSSSSRSDNTYSKEAVLDPASGLNMQTWEIDHDYLKTLGMELVAGRNFSKEFGTDSNAVIINETTAKILGFPNVIGANIYYSGDGSGSNVVALKIIGVVKNFHFESLHHNVGPLCFRLGKSTGIASFKVNTGNIKDLVAKVESTWKKMAPGMPFSYRFLDEAFDNMYRVEQRMGKLALAFSILAIVVACMGLFGLATYAAEQRIKEIGIRKVLGATVSGIVEMLSLDFMKLVLVSAVIAFPLSWWAMNKWLTNFAYRIDISWWIFLVAAAIALFIALSTISYQAIRAALMNPVKSLRTE
jgi:putative ABC transport system permease protein